MPKIKDYILQRKQYKIDYNYQRPSGAWSNEDNQCLIDTILKGEPVPLFFLNYKSDEDVFYVVDGQQRLSAIELFYDNKLKLSEKFSGNELHGSTYNGSNKLPKEYRDKYLDYDLKFHIMEDYDDERVRLIFSRLQRGKPLQLGERLNAAPGEIVVLMRELAQKKFLSKSIGVSKSRYGVYPDAARMLFYEVYGAKQCGTNELNRFFDEYENLSKTSKQYKRAISVVNFLEDCFPPDPGDYKYLEKHSWVVGVYTMISELSKLYVLKGHETNIQKFINSFHSKVYNETFRKSNTNYQKFYDNVRGGWSEKLMMLRRDILIKEFLAKNELKEYDHKRQISDEEKIAKFSETQECEYCHQVKFKDYKQGEYHHIEQWHLGGASEKPNIMLLCKDCHKLVHGKGSVKIPKDIEFNGEED